MIQYFLRVDDCLPIGMSDEVFCCLYALSLSCHNIDIVSRNRLEDLGNLKTGY